MSLAPWLAPSENRLLVSSYLYIYIYIIVCNFLVFINLNFCIYNFRKDNFNSKGQFHTHHTCLNIDLNCSFYISLLNFLLNANGLKPSTILTLNAISAIHTPLCDHCPCILNKVILFDVSWLLMRNIHPLIIVLMLNNLVIYTVINYGRRHIKIIIFT